MYNCPCCSSSLLRHIRGTEVYWFCRTCWQEMPILSLSTSNLSAELGNAELHTRHKQLIQAKTSAFRRKQESMPKHLPPRFV